MSRRACRCSLPILVDSPGVHNRSLNDLFAGEMPERNAHVALIPYGNIREVINRAVVKQHSVTLLGMQEFNDQNRLLEKRASDGID